MVAAAIVRAAPVGLQAAAKAAADAAAAAEAEAAAAGEAEARQRQQEVDTALAQLEGTPSDDEAPTSNAGAALV